MQITEHIHGLKIPFTIPVSPEASIDRLVYVYLVISETITLIDSGVAGAETSIFEYIQQCGRNPMEISQLILSHSHPDHLGSAKAIVEETNCSVAAHSGEKDWIEDTDRQAAERPVPGFRSLVNGPVTIDQLLEDGEVLDLGASIPCRVIHTPGHSKGSISLYFENDRTLFTADSLPLQGDLPIYENIADCVASLTKIKRTENVKTLISSLEAPIEKHEAIEKRINEGFEYLKTIHKAVLIERNAGKEDLNELTKEVVKKIGLPPLAANPITARAFASSLEAEDLIVEL